MGQTEPQDRRSERSIINSADFFAKGKSVQRPLVTTQGCSGHGGSGTWLQWVLREPPGWQSQGRQPRPLAMSQCSAAHWSHSAPTTLGRQEHCPVSSSQGMSCRVPSTLQEHPEMRRVSLDQNQVLSSSLASHEAGKLLPKMCSPSPPFAAQHKGHVPALAPWCPPEPRRQTQQPEHPPCPQCSSACWS